MMRKRTIIITAVVGCLFLALTGRYSLLLAPATIGWVITIFASKPKRRRQTQIFCGISAAFCLFVQVPVLTVILIVCEQAGDTTIRNPSALALIALFVVYLVSLISYFGRILGTRSNTSLEPTPTAPPALTKP
jgi:hypothetical protein